MIPVLSQTRFLQSVLTSLIVAVVACTPPERNTDTSATAPATAPEAPAPPPAVEPAPASQEIYIDSVLAANPLVITGRARTFENAVSLRARDARGALIVEQFVISVGEMGQHNPYEARLWIVRDPGGRVTVDAFEYSAKDGSVRSLTSKSAAYDVEAIPATLMFPAGDCTKIEPFPRKVPKSIAMARLLTEALVAGPTAEERAAGATPPFPAGSQVRSVIMRDGEVIVDFNERLQNVGGSCAATAIRESVVRTLKTLPSVKKVTITAGGSEGLALQP